MTVVEPPHPASTQPRPWQHWPWNQVRDSAFWFPNLTPWGESTNLSKAHFQHLLTGSASLTG